MNYRKTSKSVWRVDIIVSICAMLVSLATFGIYLYQTKIIQEQAKASVYPHLEVVREYNNANNPFIIYVKNVGLRVASPDIAAQIARGEKVDARQYYFRTSPKFEAPAGKYGWINSTLFICTGEKLPDAVLLKVYRVL